MKFLLAVITLLSMTNLANASRNSYRCFNYVATQLEDVYTPSYAQAKAKSYCKHASLPTIKFAFPKYNEIYTVDFAMKKSAEKAKEFNIRRKRNNFELAFEVFDESFTTGYALERTFKIARDLMSVDYYCLDSEYRTYRGRYTAEYSFKKALRNCLDY